MMKKILIVFSLGIILSGAGCQKVRKIFIKPPPEGVVQESYPIKVYAYQSSVVVKATPQELVESFLDFSPLENVSGILQFEFKDLSPDVDMTRVGQSIDIDVRIVGLNLPFKFITFKYKPDKEVWLMLLTDGSWLLLRFELKPIQEGTMVSVNAIGRASKNMSAILDTLPLVESTVSRLDFIMALFQSEFDPQLDAKELTKKGLRGELYEAFLQSHEASVWVNADAEDVAQWIINNLDWFMPEIKLKGDCSSFRVFDELSEGQVRPCPGEVEFRNLKVDVNTFLLWGTEGKESFYRLYLQGLNQIGFIQFGVSPEAGGSRVEAMVVIEIPGPASPRIIDIMMALAAIPKRLGEALVDIKKGVENIS